MLKFTVFKSNFVLKLSELFMISDTRDIKVIFYLKCYKSRAILSTGISFPGRRDDFPAIAVWRMAPKDCNLY